jgi:hypothetical protein
MLKMTVVFCLLLVLTSSVWAEVSYESLHYSDMQILDATIAMHYFNYTVVCLNQDGSINIGIIFPDNWTGSDNQFGQLGYCIGAAGGFTTNTSWHSDNLFVIYNNKGFSCTTRAAREFANNVEYWSDNEIANWIYYNLSSDDL